MQTRLKIDLESELTAGEYSGSQTMPLSQIRSLIDQAPQGTKFRLTLHIEQIGDKPLPTESERFRKLTCPPYPC